MEAHKGKRMKKLAPVFTYYKTGVAAAVKIYSIHCALSIQYI
jgi:hypothetical protein